MVLHRRIGFRGGNGFGDSDVDRSLVRDRNYRGLAAFEVALIEVLSDIAESVQACADEQEETVGQLKDLAVAVREIRAILKPKSILTLELSIMPKTIPVGGTASARIAATGTDGKPFTLSSADQIALVAGTAADVTIGAPTFNSDGTASVPLVGVNADASDPITATVDGVQSNSDTLTIEAPAPTVQSVTLTLE